MLVRVAADTVRSLDELGSAEIDALSQKYRDLWRLYVFLDPEYQSELERAGEVCASFFGLPNELRRRRFTDPPAA